MIVIDFDTDIEFGEMYAYISLDRKGNAGLCAGESAVGLVPFVSLNLEGMARYKPYLPKLRAQVPDKEIKLIKFKAVEEIYSAD